MNKEHGRVGFTPYDCRVYQCKVMVTANGDIERGKYIQITSHGTVRECTNTETLIDPFGEAHFPHIVGYTIDAIKDGCTGRAVFSPF